MHQQHTPKFFRRVLLFVDRLGKLNTAICPKRKVSIVSKDVFVTMWMDDLTGQAMNGRLNRYKQQRTASVEMSFTTSNGIE